MCVSYGARWRAHGDHSPCATPRQQLRSFYISERAVGARAFGCHCSCFSLSLCVSVSRRFSSLQALCFRLCRRSASRLCGALHLVSAGTHVSSLPALCSLCSRLLALCLVFASVLLLSLVSTLLPSLLCFRLISPRLRLSLVAWPSTYVLRVLYNKRVK